MRTLGYWEAYQVDDCVAVISIPTQKEFDEGRQLRNGGYDLAHCFGPDRLDNVALMAAAPELRTALETILSSGLTKKNKQKGIEAVKKSRRQEAPV